MIDADEVGQKKLQEIVAAQDEADWTDWELDFISNTKGREYKALSSRERSVIGRLHDKLLK